jgi:CBS domain-containing protein
MKVSELMDKEPVIVFGGNTVKQASEKMAEKGHGLAVVLDNIQDRNVIGVITDKDIVGRVIAKGLSYGTTMVSDVMVTDVVSISPEATTSDVMILMIDKGIKRVIVIENGVLQGIISSNYILQAMVKYKKALLDMAIDF